MIILAFMDVVFVRNNDFDKLNRSRMHANRNDVAHYAGKKIDFSFFYLCRIAVRLEMQTIRLTIEPFKGCLVRK